jgi:hypothetical protein
MEGNSVADHSVKLILTREQRRTIDRAAKAAGLKTGPWARSELLKLAQVSGVVRTLQAAPKPASTPLPSVPLCRYCGAPPSSKHKPNCPSLLSPADLADPNRVLAAQKRPLVPTYDPDAP